MHEWDLLLESTLNLICVDPLNKKIRIELTCAWGDKERKQIVANGVEDFFMNEMRLSNIVDRVICFSCTDATLPDSSVGKTLYFLMRGRYPDISELEWPPFQEKLARVQSGALRLLQIEPVYGAAIIVLAEEIRLQEVVS